MIQSEHTALEEGMMTKTSAKEKQLWTHLWKLKVVPKVHVFWWRVLRGILQVQGILKTHTLLLWLGAKSVLL